jgi:hypothetical protein
MTFCASFEAFHKLQCETIRELLGPLMDFMEEQVDHEDLESIYHRVVRFAEVHTQFRSQFSRYKIKKNWELCDELNHTCQVVSDLALTICLAVGKFFEKHGLGENEKAHELNHLGSTYYMKWVCRMRAHGMKIPSIRELLSSKPLRCKS